MEPIAVDPIEAEKKLLYDEILKSITTINQNFTALSSRVDMLTSHVVFNLQPLVNTLQQHLQTLQTVCSINLCFINECAQRQQVNSMFDIANMAVLAKDDEVWAARPKLQCQNLSLQDPLVMPRSPPPLSEEQEVQAIAPKTKVLWVWCCYELTHLLRRGRERPRLTKQFRLLPVPNGRDNNRRDCVPICRKTALFIADIKQYCNRSSVFQTQHPQLARLHQPS
jgi:hypothetical protein